MQVPSAACRTAPVTRLLTAASMLYVKHRPETCGKRPLAPGIEETPFSSIAFSSAPLISTVATTLPNGRTARIWPRVIWYGGGVKAGQKPVPPPAGGQVRRSRRPPELVIANSTPIDAYFARIASVVTLPTSDSHSRPSTTTAHVGPEDLDIR